MLMYIKGGDHIHICVHIYIYLYMHSKDYKTFQNYYRALEESLRRPTLRSCRLKICDGVGTTCRLLDNFSIPT